MKITGLKVNNFLIIKNVEIENLNSKLVTFVGKNKKGKTSFLKAITAGLRGTTDPSVIREGADKSEIMLDIEGIKVHRTITSKGQNRLKVTTPGGDIKASPQTFLDGLLSNFSFDPIRFVLMESKDRVKYLRDLFKTKLSPGHLKGIIEPELLEGIDFEKDGLTILSELEAMLYPVRREKNKMTAQKKAHYEETIKPLAIAEFSPNFKDVSTELQEKITILKDKISEAQVKERQAEGTKDLLEGVKKKIEVSKDVKKEIVKAEGYEFIVQISTMEYEIETINKTITNQVTLRNLLQNKINRASMLKGREDELDREIETHVSTLASLPKPEDVPDVAPLQTTLTEALTLEKENERGKGLMNIHGQAEEIKKDWLEYKKQSDSLTLTIKQLREDLPVKISKEAKFPISNLRFEGEKVFIGKTSMDNLSTAEQIETSLTIVRELNKGAKLKMLCLDRAESLDDDELKEFQKQIKNDEFQYFITIVTHKGQEVPPHSLFVEEIMKKA